MEIVLRGFGLGGMGRLGWVGVGVRVVRVRVCWMRMGMGMGMGGGEDYWGGSWRGQWMWGGWMRMCELGLDWREVRMVVGMAVDVGARGHC